METLCIIQADEAVEVVYDDEAKADQPDHRQCGEEIEELKGMVDCLDHFQIDKEIDSKTLSGFFKDTEMCEDVQDQFMNFLKNESSSSSDTESDDDLYFRRKVKPTVNEVNTDDDEDDEDSDDGGAAKKEQKPKKYQYVKTKGELTVEELPEEQFEYFSLDQNIQMNTIGIIHSIVDNLLVIKSNKGTKPLDEGTIIFDKNRKSIGKIYETFGPVCQPFYSIRINSKKLETEFDYKFELQSDVNIVPNSVEYTKFIFNVDQLKQIKGSDASWNNDNEPPVECIDYSDDEQERAAKARLKNKDKPHQAVNEDKSSPQKPQQQQQPYPQRQNYTQHQARPRFSNQYQQQQQQQHHRPHNFPYQQPQAFQPLMQMQPQMHYHMAPPHPHPHPYHHQQHPMGFYGNQFMPQPYQMMPQQYQQQAYMQPQPQQQQPPFGYPPQFVNTPQAQQEPHTPNNVVDRRFIQNDTNVKKSF